MSQAWTCHFRSLSRRLSEDSRIDRLCHGIFVCRRGEYGANLAALRPSQERCAFVAVSRTKVVSTQGKVTQRKTLSRLSRDIQPLSLFGCHRGLTRNPGMSFTECTFVYGYPVHSNLLVVRCSDVWTIAHASSSAEGFLIGPVRLPEFFRGCGGANQRQCGQNLCLQDYEIRAPRAVCLRCPIVSMFPS